MTSTSSDYITEEEFLAYIKSNANQGDPVTTDAISAASRAVDNFCNRIFYQLDGVTRYYSPCLDDFSSYWLLQIDDLVTTSGLVVRTDTARDGSYATTLTINTDFVPEPVNQQFGAISAAPAYPYTALRSTKALVFPVRYYPWERPTVRVTGKWGWASVPDPVKQATKILVAQYVKMREAPLGVAGWGAYGDIRVRDIPQVANLLMPYRDGGGFGIA